MDRRTFLGICSGAVAAGVTGCSAPPPRDGRTDMFGAAIDDELLNDPDGVYAYLSRCVSLTPEIEMKWDYLCPERGAYDFSAADRIVDFGVRHGMSVRGHTLLWHRSIPAWAADTMLANRDWTEVGNHLATVVERYRDRIDRWDVVNEPLDGGNLRDSPFLQAFGPSYLDMAFQAVKQSAPDAKTYLNEYGLEYALDVEGAKRLALLRLAGGLLDKGVPIDGIGLQAHLDLSKGPLYVEGIYGLVRDLGAMGLEVEITELDVLEADTSLPPEQRDMLVADEVRRYLDVVLQFGFVRSVTTWGLGDAHSWLPEGNRGLPFDHDWRPKLLMDALEDCLGRHRHPHR